MTPTTTITNLPADAADHETDAMHDIVTAIAKARRAIDVLKADLVDPRDPDVVAAQQAYEAAFTAIDRETA